jgi:hypothetical protein
MQPTEQVPQRKFYLLQPAVARHVNCTQLATVSLSAWLGYSYFVVQNLFFIDI